MYARACRKVENQSRGERNRRLRTPVSSFKGIIPHRARRSFCAPRHGKREKRKKEKKEEKKKRTRCYVFSIEAESKTNAATPRAESTALDTSERSRSIFDFFRREGEKGTAWLPAPGQKPGLQGFTEFRREISIWKAPPALHSHGSPLTAQFFRSVVAPCVVAST